MQSALYIPEVRHAICAELSRDALSKLSRISHDWSDVANIYLWETLENLVPLLCLMPADAWYLLPDASPSEASFNLTRPLTPIDWDPVLRRSSLVKVLSLQEYDAPTYATAAAQSMCHCPPPSTLLPRLRSLSFNTYADPQFRRSQFQLQLITSSLRVLRVEGPWPPGIGFMHVAASCPELESYGCDIEQVEATSSEIASDLARAVFGWRSLTVVELGLGRLGLTAVLPVLAQLPSLASVSLRCFGDPQKNLLLPKNSFPSLVHLTLCYLQLPVMATIFRSWTMRPIATFSVTPNTGSSPEELLHTLGCLQEHCEPLNLHDLHISLRMNDPDGWSIRLEHLAPLAHFPNLRRVAVYGPGQHTDINDDEFAQMVQWWPHLQRLDLGTNVYHGGSGRLCSLSALSFFAVGCEDLTYLSLPLAAAVVPNIDSNRMKRHFNLSGLDVGNAPIEDPWAVALFLSALFPNLNTVKYEKGTVDVDVDDLHIAGQEEVMRQRMAQWDLVNKILTVLRKKEAQTWASNAVYYEAVLPGFRHALASALAHRRAG
ncbi:hypothetical protein BD626DRAFT_510029 [Schizophyllum amplum]|uniref:F-box domain-containing protein n=1 Tax=Schizophyllum amplum TaxID=97359 RepID=A0A550C265_9AGAR|nr:hypothetical protein BD626DRAFT_510029 [Auriculariopsis ampla]